MEPRYPKLLCFSFALVFSFTFLPNPVSPLSPCSFPAVFNFGDSNSDTGGLSAAFGKAPSPNGETYFGAPAGRFSDGRLIIDFIGICICIYINFLVFCFILFSKSPRQNALVGIETKASRFRCPSREVTKILKFLDFWKCPNLEIASSHMI